MSYITRFFKFIFQYIFFTGVLISLWYAFSLIPKKQKENAILTVRIEDTAIEDHKVKNFPFMKSTYSVEQLRQLIKSATRDPKIKGLVIELFGTKMGLTQVDELAEQLQLFKAQKKPVFVFADVFGYGCNSTAAYLLATYADKIYLAPNGMVNCNGIIMVRYFLKSLLEHYAIKPIIERRDDYKGFPDTVLFDEYSPPVRENITAVATDVMDLLAAKIAKNRGLTTDKVKELINKCPLMDTEAIAEKMIDERIYFDPDNLPEPLQKLKKDTCSKLISAKKYPLYPQDKQKHKIALIYMSGSIMRYTPKGEVFDQTLTDRRVQKLLKRALKENCKAVVLRINSGGGDSQASRNMHNSLAQFKRKKIPVVVSMGDYCASGGYMLAAGADYIFAHPYTLTGSIGVAAGRFYIKEFAKKYNVNFDGIKVGDNADIYHMAYDMSETQRAWFKKAIDADYTDFLKKVWEGRKISEDKLRADIAGGRVWSGRQGKDLGLVDALGGIDMAVTKAADLAQVADYEVLTLPSGDVYDVLAELQDDGLSGMVARQVISCFHTATSALFSPASKSEMSIRVE